MHAMQSREGRPHRLFDKLHQSNLLFLGVGFPDWLARFFLRLAKNGRLSETRDRIEILADGQLRQTEGLAYFCDRFCRETSIYQGSAVEFVNGLFERWKERAAPPPPPPDETPTPKPVETIMERGAVFISYASDDREEAKRLKDTLEAGGIDVWYDQDKLYAGNMFEDKIRQNIRRCSLFLPVISTRALSRDEGFFRREWRWGVDRLSDLFGADRPFIIPVVIDQTAPSAPRLPAEFKQVHWMNAPGGVLRDDSIARLREDLRCVIKQERVNA
jgi:hypothetical protein